MAEWKSIPVVYVAGPYRAPTEWGVFQNIRHAEGFALDIWKLGAAVVCPHKNTEMFGGAAPDSVWLEGDKAILAICHAVFAMPTWRQSSGATAEIDLAIKLGIPVFENLDGLREWINTYKDMSYSH